MTCLLLIRVAPLPLGVKNYGLALTPCPLGLFFLATGIVNVPFAMLWCSFGTMGGGLIDALDAAEKSGPENLAYVAGGGVAVAVVTYIGKQLFVSPSTAAAQEAGDAE